jgi:hypothetical protein
LRVTAQPKRARDGFDRQGAGVPTMETTLMAFFMPGPKR